MQKLVFITNKKKTTYLSGSYITYYIPEYKKKEILKDQTVRTVRIYL